MAGGEFYCAADFVLDGTDASTTNGYGGVGVLNPWNGRSSESLAGYGPGGAPANSLGLGQGATYSYNLDGALLVPGSSGSSGASFQGSGAGGGALQLMVAGDFTLASGALITASGGNGRSDQNPLKVGGGGSGGAVQIFAQNIYNRGMIRVLGGNGGAGDGQILLASPGEIEEGIVDFGNGNLITITPPQIDLPPTQYLTFGKAVEKRDRQEVQTRPENLKLHWPMEEKSGVTLKDSVGVLDGNLAGKFTRVAGKIGQAIEFDGSSGYAWTEPIASKMGITGKNARSISFWIWLNAYQPSPNTGAYGYGQNSVFDGTDRFWGIESLALSNFSSFVSQHYGFNFSLSHDLELRNTWNHFTHTFDGSSISVFVNGQLVGSENRSSINTGDTEPLVIGRSSTEYNSFMSGRLDDFRIYNAALTPLEISKIHTANDILEKSYEFQFDLEITGANDSVTLVGLPDGLHFDPVRMEVTGVPQQVGTFDLNLTASNQAGTNRAQFQITVEKSLPVLSSVKPRGISSNGALATSIIQSNGGEDVSMTVFWGHNNGGKNPGLWENNFTVEGDFSEGRVSHFIDNLDLGTTYYYRWMASNSVSEEIWSEPSMDGLLNWWSFDQILGETVVDSAGNINGILMNISPDARTIGIDGLGLPFTGSANEKVSISGYKGIPGNDARTVSLWVNISSPDSTLLDWGGDGSGKSWTLVIEDGKPGLKVDPNLTWVADRPINDSNWHHLAVCLTAGSQELSDVSIYVDGEPSETSVSFNLDPSTYGPSLWLDATDIDGDEITDIPSSGSISSWNDKSGNNLNATQLNSSNQPTLTSSTLNGKPVVSFDGTDDYLSSAGLNITQPYSIFFVAKTTNNTLGRDYLFDGLGSNQNHRSLVALDNSGKIQMWAYNTWANSNFDTPTEYFVLSAIFNTSNSSLSLNGTSATGLSIGSSNLTNGIRIGVNCNANADFLKGSIAEFLILNEASDESTINHIEGYLAHKWGLTPNLDPSHPSSVDSLAQTRIDTSVDRDLSIGGYLSGGNFNGTLDEIKIYDRGLSAAEVGTLFLDGTVKFTTTTTRQPPVVELYDALPDSNDSVVLQGELTNVDQENPIVTIYYGSSDGGLSADGWENNITINGGNPLPAGHFQATIDGLNPGERYYFRAYAVSTDGADWSTGEPEIKEDLLALWRLDEDSGNLALDSVVPLRNATINGQDANQTRTQGHSGNALKFDGGDDWMNLDSYDTGYLGEPFEGRTFMAWMKISSNLYAGPAITEYGDLAAHFPFNLGFGKTVYDSNYDQLEGSLEGDTNWASGRFDESVIFSTDADHIRIPATDSLSDLHDGSFSLSLWVNPDQTSEKYTHGRLNAYSFELEKSDYYLNGIENLLSLSPSFSSILEDEETIDLETFSPEDIPGLLIWLDASHADSFDINQTNNSVLEWSNRVVGQAYDFNLVWGDPTRKFTSGKWTVNFDGDDMLGTTSDLHHSSYKNYTALSISRQTGGDNQRLISSSHNWLMGYHGGGNNKFYFNGWLHGGSDTSDTNWHLHSVKLNYDEGSTWKDLIPGAINGNGASDKWPNPAQIRFGGWRNLEETSKGEVSAFLFYDRALSDGDILGLQYYLANKWNMTDQLQFDFNRKVKLSSHEDFRTLNLTSNSNYQNSLTLLTGTFHAKETGFYQWELLNTSEQSALWIDQNQNGFFETDERLLYYAGEGLNNLVLDSIDLNEGNYSFAIYHAVGSDTPSVEARFSTPSSNSGPSSLTTIHPSGPNQSDLFSTPIRSTLIRRGPLQLGINGDGTVFFKFVTLDNHNNNGTGPGNPCRSMVSPRSFSQRGKLEPASFYQWFHGGLHRNPFWHNCRFV